MSSIRKLFASRAKDFELGVKHFQDAKVSVTQIFKLFKDFIFCAKECIQINDEDQDDVNVIFEIIYKFLNCILDYVGVGSITAKLPYLTMVCHEIYRATCDLQLTHEFVKKLSMPIFQVLLEPEVQTWTAKEILKMFSVIVQLIDRSVRSTLIEENFIYYIARFMDMLPFVDFEFQAIILEVLFRLYTQDEIKNKKNVFFFNTEQQRKAFYSIDTKKFDYSVRLYLNVVNEIENNIKSVLCYKVCMDECVLHAPKELSSFKGLWVDFNIKVRSISLYIGIHEYIENRKKDETMWEIVTIYAGNISSADISIIYNKEKEIQEAIGIIKLKGPCIMVRQVPQKLIKTTTITMYSTNIQKLKNIFNNDIPKMTNRKIKGSFVPLNRRGYKPLDIISIKSSVTNHSSVLNHTINTDIVCNNSTKDKSSVKKAKRSICTKDKIKEKITKTNSYGESFMSQSIDIPPETNDKIHKQSYSYGEAFRTIEEVVSRNKMIKSDESSCGYGEKFLSSLIDIDELFKDHDIPPEGGNKVVVRASTINKKLHPVCSEPNSIVLRSHVRNNENVSKTLNETKINKTKVTDESNIKNNNAKQQIRKKTLIENKKQSDQSSSHNSEVKKSESIRRVNVSETHCSPELFSSQMEFSCTQKNIYKSVSADKIIFRDVIQTSNHLGSPDRIRDNCYIDPFDALKLEIPNRNLLLEENPKIDSTIEEQIPILINEPEFELLRKPSNSDSVHIVPISSLSDIEPPDYFPDDDCKIETFDALKLEIPNLKSQGEKCPKVHSTIEEPIPIRVTEPITEPLSIPANSSSDDTIKGDLKNSSQMKLKMSNCKLQKGENPNLTLKIKYQTLI
ncbi:hypothetical protein WA026_006995 [Henosepilachna vigintioctopunctata]|uniref:Synaptonemal complex protein 2 n=1 Tax=Henosepilachna vigintioctopunctata TaxID=420089 RepID=A0AAW1VBJ8_9CUCU